MAAARAVHEHAGMPVPVPATLDEARVATLVGCFYDKVRVDPLLGPIFNPLVDDWDAHKVLMTSFWATVALRTGHYRGNPLAKHQPLPIGVEHFQRWLALWRETAQAQLDTDAAALMIGYAERIGYGMRVGMGLTGHLRGRESGIPIRARQSA
ncbi:MAG TPA: group III truncated hemoglobin [Rhodanobacteraceae bacterium]